MVDALRAIGVPLKRKEDPRLISGEGSYTDDVQLKGMVYMAVLRSPHAHARIRHLDVSAAKAHPEVVSVLTGPGDTGAVPNPASPSWNPGRT